MDHLIFYILGLFMGSFLHVIAYRSPKGVYFSKTRSVCPCCQEVLSWFELLPLFSYLLQKGECFNCHNKISPVYPASEFICGLLYFYSFVKFGYSVELLFVVTFISILFVLAMCDFYYYLLPNIFVLSLGLLVLLWSFHAKYIPFQESLLTTLFSLLLIGLLIYFTEGGMGMGDFKLLAVLAYFFGFYNYLQLLFLASLLAIGYFIVLKIILKKYPKYIFFGPFIGVAACILLLT